MVHSGPFIRCLGDVAQAVKEIRYSAAKEYEKQDRVNRLVIESLGHFGKFYLASDQQCYWFNNETHELMSISGYQFGSWLSEFLDLSPASRMYKQLLSRLDAHIQQHGEEVELRSIGYYNAACNKLYLDQFDGHMLVLDGQSPNRVPNGTDGVLFSSDVHGQPWQLMDVGESDEATFDRLLLEGNYDEDAGVFTKAEAQVMKGFWLAGIPFRSYVQTYPFALFKGPAGSGKSYQSRVLLKFLLGNKAEVSMVDQSRSSDVDTALTNRPVLAFDNVDGKVPWLANKIAIASTGGGIDRRQLYTTNKMVSFPMQTTIMVSSREPKFIRDDIAERALPLVFKKRSDFQPENQLIAEMLACRDRLWSVYVCRLNKSLAIIAEHEFPTLARSTRMAEFQALSMVFARAWMPWVNVEDLFRKLRIAQAHLLGEEDAFIQVLIEVLTDDRLGQKLYATELSLLLKKSAAYRMSNSRNTLPDGPVAVGRALTAAIRALKEICGIEVETGHDRKGNYYVFTRSDD